MSLLRAVIVKKNKKIFRLEFTLYFEKTFYKKLECLSLPTFRVTEKIGKAVSK